MRDRHASYFADEATARWETWNGPRQRIALDWIAVEFANLRVGFRWAADQDDLATATTIAAHVALMGWSLQRFEPVGRAEEILKAATTADVPQLPRLYTAASVCQSTGRPEEGVAYAQTAMALESDTRYDPFEIGWSAYSEVSGHVFAGRMEQGVELCTELAAQTGLPRVLGLCGMLFLPRAAGRADESRAIADETLSTARDHGNPFLIAFGLNGYGRAFMESDPERALTSFREGLLYAREQRNLFWEANIARDAAGHEAMHGDREAGLELFDTAIDSTHRDGNVAVVAIALAQACRIPRPSQTTWQRRHYLRQHRPLRHYECTHQRSDGRRPPAGRARGCHVRSASRHRGRHGGRAMPSNTLAARSRWHATNSDTSPERPPTERWCHCAMVCNRHRLMPTDGPASSEGDRALRTRKPAPVLG